MRASPGASPVEVLFDALCVACGARPRPLPGVPQSLRGVLTVRDTDSVASLAAALHAARRVLVVGNGGIAMELVCVICCFFFLFFICGFS